MRLKTIIILGIIVCATISSNAQNTLAKIEYAEAETDFQAGNFTESLAHLETVKEMLGSTNAKVMHLETMALYMSYAKEFIASPVFNESMTKGLQSYSTEDIQTLYKGYLQTAGYTVDENLNVMQHPKASEAMTNVVGNLILLTDRDLFRKRLLAATKILAISNTYITNFEDSVPIEKLKDIYSINKNVSAIAKASAELEKGLLAFDNKDYETARSFFTDACIEGNTAGCAGASFVILTMSQKKASIDDINDVMSRMIMVKGGTYKMGGKVPKLAKELQPLPEHEVTISNFYMGRHEIDVEFYDMIMEIPSLDKKSYIQYDKKVKTRISRDMALEFITKLNKKTGKTFRLPTEAEWEFAARGGNKTEGYKYSGGNNLKDVAIIAPRAMNIGLKSPNELGIYDMTSNVYEWCSDYYSPDYYSQSPKENPLGPESGSRYVIRGGASNSDKHAYFNWFRNSLNASSTIDNVGLRLAMDAN